MTLVKDSPRIVFDETGEPGSVYPESAISAEPTLIAVVMRGLGKNGRERLRDFCASPPGFPDDHHCGVKNHALFRLRSRKYSYAVAVKSFRFPGYITELYPVPAEGTDRVIVDNRLTDSARRILAELLPDCFDGELPGGPSPFPSLAESAKRSVSFQPDGQAGKIVSSVIRQLRARPGAVCGEVRVMPPDSAGNDEGPCRATVSPGVLACILSLLASALSRIFDACPTEVRTEYKGGTVRIDVIARPKKRPRAFFATDDVLSLGGALGREYGTVAAAYVIAEANNVSVSSLAGEDGAAGFRVTLFPSFGEAPEFKEDLECCLLDKICVELSRFLTEPPEGAEREEV